MRKEDYYSILRSVINEEIIEIVGERNKIESTDKFSYQQIFNFLYRDGQAMLTIGGIFFSEEDKLKIVKMNLQNLDFIMDSDQQYEIKVYFIMKMTNGSDTLLHTFSVCRRLLGLSMYVLVF